MKHSKHKIILIYILIVIFLKPIGRMTISRINLQNEYNLNQFQYDLYFKYPAREKDKILWA